MNKVISFFFYKQQSHKSEDRNVRIKSTFSLIDEEDQVIVVGMASKF